MARLRRSQLAAVAASATVAVGLGLAGAAGPVGRRTVEAAAANARLVAMGVGIALGLTAGALLVVVLRRLGGSAGGWVSGGVRGRAGALVLGLAVVAGLVAIDTTDGPPSSAESSPPPATVAADGQTSAPGSGGRLPPSGDDREPRRADFGVSETAVLLLGLVLLAAAVVYFARRTETRAIGHEGVYLRSDLELDPPDDEVPDDADLADAMRATRRSLTGDGSPAERILAAYATMLAAFAEIGLARHRSEPPAAYVGRCLRAGSLPTEAVTSLLHLFELARFSQATLGEDHVRQATDALDAIVADLGGVAT
jgi:hypothetical protein